MVKKIIKKSTIKKKDELKSSKELYNKVKEEVEKKYELKKKMAKIKSSAFNLLGVLLLIAIPFSALDWFTGVILAIFCFWVSRSIKQYYLLI